MYLMLALLWRRAGAVEETYEAQMKLFAYASRYGYAGEWMFHVPSFFLRDFVEQVSVIVEEENRPRK